ncbi:hypothetical protein EHQ59_13775 [Leptospira kemamanensis]|uniref:Uncharacterized protein n=1 Tax=Leptospira kemamanensis TaxID=2484942 RepID=A0A4R9JPS3_9LEPT|nr:hypothetical protein [Leptospira kemamanensis]TGL50446.1 hypothetical protein EHQ59_13775 [Leptospira kemamanensis]
MNQTNFKPKSLKVITVTFVTLITIVLLTIDCKKEPEGPTEAEKAEALRIQQEKEKRNKAIIAGLEKLNEPISSDDIEKTLSGIRMTPWGSSSLEEVKDFKFFCASSTVNYDTKFREDYSVKAQSDYTEPEYTGEWKVLAKSKASFHLEDSFGTRTVELTEKPQVLKITFKHKGEEHVGFHTFCYEETHPYAVEVVIPKLQLP